MEVVCSNSAMILCVVYFVPEYPSRPIEPTKRYSDVVSFEFVQTCLIVSGVNESRLCVKRLLFLGRIIS